MTVHVPVDAERLTVAWALANDAVSTLFTDRIYTVIPRDPVFPLARLTRIGGAPPQRLLWLDEVLIQWDVYGGPQHTTRLAADTIRAHMADSFVGAHALGTVTAIEFGSLSWLPDADFTPAKPRYTFDVRFWLHP